MSESKQITSTSTSTSRTTPDLTRDGTSSSSPLISPTPTNAYRREKNNRHKERRTATIKTTTNRNEEPFPRFHDANHPRNRRPIIDYLRTAPDHSPPACLPTSSLLLPCPSCPTACRFAARSRTRSQNNGNGISRPPAHRAPIARRLHLPNRQRATRRGR